MVDLTHLRGLVLDLDDTLYPESSFVESGFRAVAAGTGGRYGPSEEVLRRLVELHRGGHRGRVFDQFLAERLGRADPSDVAALIALYRGHAPTIALFPDAARLIERIAGRLPLALLSDGFAATQRNKLRALGIAGRFDLILFTDEWGREFWKPHPRAFQQAALWLQATANSLCYVSDNPAKDFVAPRALGWRTVQVRRPEGVYRDVVAPPGGEAEACIDSLDDLHFG